MDAVAWVPLVAISGAVLTIGWYVWRAFWGAPQGSGDDVRYGDPGQTDSLGVDPQTFDDDY